MMQQPATNYRGSQKMPSLCHHGRPEAWQQCSKIESMLSYLVSEHQLTSYMDKIRTFKKDMLEKVWTVDAADVEWVECEHVNQTSLLSQLESQINDLKRQLDLPPNDHQSKKQTIESKLDDLNNKLAKEMISRRFKLEPEQFSPEVSVKHYHASSKKVTFQCKMKQIPGNSKMMQQPATNYRECQKMLSLCHHGQPEAWQKCSKIGSMSSYLVSKHQLTSYMDKIRTFKKDMLEKCQEAITKTFS
jgi:hypothetical protein